MNPYSIGMDLGGTNLKAALFDAEMNKVAEKKVQSGAHLGSAYVLSRMADLVDYLLKKQVLRSSDIACMGIGVPGLLDPGEGISIFSPNFTAWENVPVAHYMQDRFGIPTYIDNDVRVNLYGEWQFGAGRGKRNIVLLTLGTGLGSGVIIDGNVLYGITGSAGEVGHMKLSRSDRPCKCGSKGCLGRYVSAKGLLHTVKEKLQTGRYSVLCSWTQGNIEKITAEMVSRAFDMGDSTAIEAFRETGTLLGFGLVNVINLYNPEIIILGGGLSGAGERLFKWAREIVKDHALKISYDACSIVTSELGDSAGMIGAALYAKGRLLQKSEYLPFVSWS